MKLRDWQCIALTALPVIGVLAIAVVLFAVVKYLTGVEVR